MKSIAVLVAIYKARAFIDSKIKSLLHQTRFNDCQIILLNCQNQENESELYQEFVDNNDNVQEIRYGNYVKLYESWNDGILATNSTYICNSNIDDQWHPQFLERCVDYLNKNQEIAVVSTGVLISSTPNLVWPDWDVTERMPFYVYPASSAGPCPMWRRSLHNKYGYFDTRCQSIGDALLWEKWLAGGEKFGLIDDDLVLYYRNEISLERRVNDDGIPLRDIDLRQIGRI